MKRALKVIPIRRDRAAAERDARLLAEAKAQRDIAKKLFELSQQVASNRFKHPAMAALVILWQPDAPDRFGVATIGKWDKDTWLRMGRHLHDLQMHRCYGTRFKSGQRRRLEEIMAKRAQEEEMRRNTEFPYRCDDACCGQRFKTSRGLEQHQKLGRRHRQPTGADAPTTKVNP